MFSVTFAITSAVGCANRSAVLTPAESLARADEAGSNVPATLAAIETAIKICQYNVTNADTPGFRAATARRDPAGHAYVTLDCELGSLEDTGRPLDIAVDGMGFFRVKTAKGELAYTRCGSLFVNSDGELVVGAGDGAKLMPAIVVPRNATNFSISQDGGLSVASPNRLAKTMIGNIQLYQFVNSESLIRGTDGWLIESVASGNAIEGRPGDNGSGQVIQGFLEQSNVIVPHELSRINFLVKWRAQLEAAAGLPPTPSNIDLQSDLMRPAIRVRAVTRPTTMAAH